MLIVCRRAENNKVAGAMNLIQSASASGTVPDEISLVDQVSAGAASCPVRPTTLDLGSRRSILDTPLTSYTPTKSTADIILDLPMI